MPGDLEQPLAEEEHHSGVPEHPRKYRRYARRYQCLSLRSEQRPKWRIRSSGKRADSPADRSGRDRTGSPAGNFRTGVT
jgi:hypothetical protein